MPNESAILQPPDPSFFSSPEKVITLEKKLEYISEKKPVISSFLGVAGYTQRHVEYALNHIRTITDNIKYLHRKELNRNINRQENRRYTTLVEKIFVDRFNRWFPNFRATLASDFDNISRGMDVVITEKGSARIGIGIDLTSAFEIEYLTKKMNRDWHEKSINKTTEVSFYEDENGRKHPVSAMRFVVGILRADSEKLAQDCMAEEKEVNEDNFFKYLMIMQIEEQLERWLDYCFENESDPNTTAKRTQCVATERFLTRMKQSINYDTTIDSPTFKSYAAKSTALTVAKVLRDY